MNWEMTIIKKIWRKRHFLFSLPMTIFFNFRYLPFSKAVRLPVWLCRARISGKGKYYIESPVYPGMIRLGFPNVSIFNEKGILLENNGTVYIKGELNLGAGSAISVGEKGKLTFGDKVAGQAGAKLVCYHKILLGDKVRIGWNTIMCDTDFHSMKNITGNKRTKGYGPIIIEDEVWIGSFCKIYKNTFIPRRCTLSANTLVNKKIECEPYSLIYSGDGIKIKPTGYYRDMDDDIIEYPDNSNK